MILQELDFNKNNVTQASNMRISYSILISR